MVDNIYIFTRSSTETVEFTMPGGFSPEVEVHCWGAGGGAGYGGAPGGAGGYAFDTVIINQGDSVSLQVGNKGLSAPNASVGGAGGRDSSRREMGGGGGGNRGSWCGNVNGPFPSGGGGGASYVMVNNKFVAVGAGGGGGGGYGHKGYKLAGSPGGIYTGYATGVRAVSHGAWSGFLNTYGVWGGGQDYTVSVNFPTTGTYTFTFAVDNYGSISLDGTPIISLSGTVTSHFKTPTTETVTVSAGIHTIRVQGVNTGGPAGVGAQILKPDSTNLWNTRSLIISSGLSFNSQGGDASWGGGGGGGYPFGGESGYASGHAVTGGQGGMNYGIDTLPGDGSTPGGVTTAYFPKNSAGKPTYTVAGPDQDGYIVMVFTRVYAIKYKESSTWKGITDLFVKTPNIPVIKSTNPAPITVNFNSPGSRSWSVPDGVTSIRVTGSGGGGQGGNGDGGANNDGSGYGGGGSDLITRSYDVSPLQVLTVQVGAGGDGSTGDGNSGGNTIVSGTGVDFRAEGGGGGGGVSGWGGAGRRNGTGVNGATNASGQSPGTTTNGGANGGGGGPYSRNGSRLGYAGENGKARITYTPPVEYYTIIEGGWKAITRAWVKVNGMWKELISTATIEAAISQTITYDTFITSTFTVPTNVTKLNFVAVGGGGGGGGRDSATGYPGYGGYILTGNLSVTPGDVITIAPGSGGAGGADDARSGAGGGGGTSSLDFDGGRGGSSGGSGISGAGGGGGAASAVLLNGNVVVVAAGGAGGGGAGNGPRGLPSAGYSNSGAYYGSAGADKSGDGGGAGGGGGGFWGGAGGALVGGDSGAYSGSDGANKAPSGWDITRAANGGNEGIRGVQGATAGGHGYVVLSYVAST